MYTTNTSQIRRSGKPPAGRSLENNEDNRNEGAKESNRCRHGSCRRERLQSDAPMAPNESLDCEHRHRKRSNDRKCQGLAKGKEKHTVWH